MTATILEALDRLAELRAMAQALELKRQELRDAAIPADVRDALNAIDAELLPSIAAAQGAATEVEAEVKALVIAAGESVKGATLHAVFTGGRETWDGKLLAGFALAHPEIAAARKVGQPSVSIRASK